MGWKEVGVPFSKYGLLASFELHGRTVGEVRGVLGGGKDRNYHKKKKKKKKKGLVGILDVLHMDAIRRQKNWGAL